MIRGQVVCDGCGKVGMQSGGPKRYRFHAMRVKLHAEGWAQKSGGRDLCPTCREGKRLHREKRKIGYLTKRETQIRTLYREDYTYKEIGEIIGLSGSRIGTIMQKIRYMVRKGYKDYAE